MIKRILTVIGLSSCLFCANAEKLFMTVEQLDGSKFSFLIDDNPIITYEDGNLVINSNASTSYAISSLKNYHFTEGNETGIKNPVADMLRIVSLDETTLQVLNAQIAEKVSLFNTNGVVITETSADGEGTATIALPEQKGVYVLVVGTKSIKVIRK